jgi:hypothetical protein
VRDYTPGKPRDSLPPLNKRCKAVLSTDRWGVRLFPVFLPCSNSAKGAHGYCGAHARHAEWYNQQLQVLGTEWEERQYLHCLRHYGDEGMEAIWTTLEAEIQSKPPAKQKSILGRLNSAKLWWVEYGAHRRQQRAERRKAGVTQDDEVRQARQARGIQERRQQGEPIRGAEIGQRVARVAQQARRARGVEGAEAVEGASRAPAMQPPPAPLPPDSRVRVRVRPLTLEDIEAGLAPVQAVHPAPVPASAPATTTTAAAPASSPKPTDPAVAARESLLGSWASKRRKR